MYYIYMEDTDLDNIFKFGVKSEFSISYKKTFEIDGNKYINVEQYYESQKYYNPENENNMGLYTALLNADSISKVKMLAERKEKIPALAKKMVVNNKSDKRNIAELIDLYRDVEERENWEEIKLDVMYDGLKAKFEQNEDLKTSLLETDKKQLVFDLKKDNYWGIGKNNKGENMLGKLLMKLRTNLKEEQQEQDEETDDEDNQQDQQEIDEEDEEDEETDDEDNQQDQQEIDEEDEEDEEDESDDEEYLKKFDEDITKDHILKYHPEIVQNNYDEISALTKVIRDEENNIIDPIHQTIPILTKYERAKILGVRAKQLNQGSEPFIDLPENIIDGYTIAEMELEQKILPFIVTRPLPGGKKEYWKLRDLELIDY